jgi:hypothetical protein
MGPPLASLAKAKFSLAPDSHHAVVDDEDSDECQFAYKLLLFARDEIFQMKGCQGTHAGHLALSRRSFEDCCPSLQR